MPSADVSGRLAPARGPVQPASLWTPSPRIGLCCLFAFLLACSGDAPRSEDASSDEPPRAEPAALAPDGLPIDLETLPGMTVLWRRTIALRRTHAGAGVVLGRERGRLVALDADTGEPRWSAPLTEHEGYPLYFDAGCGVAVAFEPTAIRGFSLLSGDLLWTEPLEAPRFRYEARMGGGRVVGCELVAVLSESPRAMPTGEGDAHLVRFDVRTGAVRDDHACEDCETLRYAETDGASGMLLDTGERVLHLGPSGPAELVETRTCGNDQEAGSARCIVMRTENRLERRGDGGEVLWSTEIPGERAVEILAASASHVLLGSRHSRVITDVDPSTGAVRWVRLRPSDLDSRVRLDGDRAFFSSVGETVAVDLRREAPPARDAEPLEEDLERALLELDRNEYEEGPSRGYPTGNLEARMWIERNLPLLDPSRLASALESAPPERQLLLVSLLSDDLRAAPRAAIAALLAQTYVAEPTLPSARLRTAVADALRPPLSPERSEALADATLGWLAWLEARSAATLAYCTRGRDDCDLERQVRDAVLAASHALERSSLDAPAFDRVRAGLDAVLGMPTADCVPSETDRALSAAVSHLLALHTAPGALDVPPGSCIGLPTSPSASDRWDLRESPEDAWVPTGVPHWDEAEHHVYEWMWYAGPLAGAGGRIYLVRFGDSWRVILRATGFMI